MFRRKLRRACRCTHCGKIYVNGISRICSGCGLLLRNPLSLDSHNLEDIYVRRGIFGWKVVGPVPKKECVHAEDMNKRKKKRKKGHAQKGQKGQT